MLFKNTAKIAPGAAAEATELKTLVVNMSQRNKIVVSNTPAKYAPLPIPHFLLKNDLEREISVRRQRR